MVYKLSPSDLTYLFEGCKYCFCLKVKFNIRQPSIPMPGIFSAIASKQKSFYAGKLCREFCDILPAGIVEYGEQWVQSAQIKFSDTQSTCYIFGRFDLVVKFDDGTFGVIDCKTARPSETKSAMYARQLQCYSYALENPAPGAFSLSPVKRLGLLYFTPNQLKQIKIDEQALYGDLTWHEVERNDESFLKFLKGAINILDSESIEPRDCNHCEYCSKGNACLASKQEAFISGCTCCSWCTYRLAMQKLYKTPRVQSSKEDDISSLPCPVCNNSMVKRNGRFGDFWSCKSYPECRGTRNI
ncbi:MAG: PD-(D/E)XK nuclease family protein [Candidatus Omnitrophota bacterium]